MKGFVPTPRPVVDAMVRKLFSGRMPTGQSVVLDPGCGNGEFIDGVVRWCSEHGCPVPRTIGIESDPTRAETARQRFAAVPEIEIRCADYLRPLNMAVDFVIGNPPYVPITALSMAEREAYRSAFTSARGRFDLYLLFFEQSLRVMKPGARLVFITPEKYLYVDTATPLRELMLSTQIEALDFLSEQTFPDLVTYPVVTTITTSPASFATAVRHRDGRESRATFDRRSTWMPAISGVSAHASALTLSDVTARISCGVATGADDVFVLAQSETPDALQPFVYPTISGRQLTAGEQVRATSNMLVPYDASGQLLPESRLGALRDYLSTPSRKSQLLGRTCVTRKPWYAFHENPPLHVALQPKLLCKDITSVPHFFTDAQGLVLPRHSVYYVVPAAGVPLDELARELNSAATREWLRANCQRAANGFIRVQSQTMKRIPLPAFFERYRVDNAARGTTVEAMPA
jgi:adenine-specific DNA-methyltransferase